MEKQQRCVTRLTMLVTCTGGMERDAAKRQSSRCCSGPRPPHACSSSRLLSTVHRLAGFGDRGVEKVMELLDSEFRLVMRQTGATSIAAVREGRYLIDRRSGERL